MTCLKQAISLLWGSPPQKAVESSKVSILPLWTMKIPRKKMALVGYFLCNGGKCWSRGNFASTGQSQGLPEGSSSGNN